MTEMITGAQYALAAGPYRAVVTESGASLRELTLRQDGGDERPLVLTHGADEPAPAAFGNLLIPWPNRVDGGRYEYGGKSYRLDLSEPENDCAIHGLVRWAHWTPAEHLPHRVRLTHRLLGSGGYPFRLDLEAEYVLDAEAGLTVRMTAHNRGPVTAPYGHGAHPYLTVGEPLDRCTVTLDAARYLPVDDRMIPSGPAEDVAGTRWDLRDGPVLGDREIDNAYTGLGRDAAGRCWTTLSGGGRSVRLWSDEAHPWTEIYTADQAPEPRAGLGVEPMTCPPNAFASGEGLIDLAPGATFSGSWGIMAG
ncbi:aldose 1-epimerase family protein [Actinomadura algeriensis]|uniref:Aldose 1-epimerase n=1 Tax=Actinomadura algeriensis TaxID=1679523 RepID=A0ABR9JYS2_9ACTN|nr:aldose 1-epimerase family protein [Actinomadura algeriensis]MBE1535245.1 aldose 1-epimerase [Actinomadura algeriensis]